MHPAFSVIIFTTASGLGYGLLAVLGVAAALGVVPAERWLGFTGLGLALGLITFGLLSSTFHLGHPERAWRAMSQWRSSWLSREGAAALVTYVPAALFGIGWVFLERNDGFWALCGLLSAIGAALTVYCTGMIYASLAAIPRWHHALVTPVYLALALMTGVIWADALLRLFGYELIGTNLLAVIAILLAWLLKAAYWRATDAAAPVSTAETATGLGGLGRVRLLDAPHTEVNYLQQEMGYRVARKHASRLRSLTLFFAFALPLLLTVLVLLLTPPVANALAVIAALSTGLGVVIERWLFFAQAQHVVQLYYGEAAV